MAHRLTWTLPDAPGMDIGGIDDSREESLNKTSPTADIIAFFKPLPHMRGQPKARMGYTLCS